MQELRIQKSMHFMSEMEKIDVEMSCTILLKDKR